MRIIYFYTVLGMTKLNCSTLALMAFVVEKRRKTDTTTTLQHLSTGPTSYLDTMTTSPLEVLLFGYPAKAKKLIETLIIINNY